MEDIMICVLVKIKVRENKQKQFEEIFINLSKKIRANEEGNIFYQVARDKENTLKYIIMENYKDIESIRKHSKSLHVKDARKLFKDCFDGEPIIRHFDAI